MNGTTTIDAILNPISAECDRRTYGKRGWAVHGLYDGNKYHHGSPEWKAWWAGVHAGKRHQLWWSNHMAVQAAKCYERANQQICVKKKEADRE